MSSEDTLSAIEQTQAALRESIETSKKLVAQSDRLLQQHKEARAG